MVKVTTTQTTTKVEEIEIDAAWTKYVPRPVVVATRFDDGATVDGLVIPPGHYAVLFENGMVRAIEAPIFEAFFAQP